MAWDRSIATVGSSGDASGQELWGRYLKGTLIALRGLGVDVGRRLTFGEVELAQRKGQHLLISDVVSTLWLEAIATAKCDRVGLSASALMHPAQLFGLLYYRAQASATLGEALRKIAAYAEAASPAETFAVQRQDGCDVIQLCVLGDKVPVPQARIESGALNP